MSDFAGFFFGLALGSWAVVIRIPDPGAIWWGSAVACSTISVIATLMALARRRRQNRRVAALAREAAKVDPAFAAHAEAAKLDTLGEDP